MKEQRRSSFGLKTIIVIMLVLAVLSYIALALIQCAKDNASEAPDAKVAPYLITTGSRVYLAQDGRVLDAAGNVIRNFSLIVDTYSLEPDESIILTNWYDMNYDSKWKQYKGDSPAYSVKAYADIKVTKREIKTKENK